jgi:hypothetical protein
VRGTGTSTGTSTSTCIIHQYRPLARFLVRVFRISSRGRKTKVWRGVNTVAYSQYGTGTYRCGMRSASREVYDTSSMVAYV